MVIKYSIELKEKGREFPHYWELCIGSCHATTVLREDVRNQIRKAHEECGFQYLRFHGLFDDDMSVVIGSMLPGQKTISFYNIDSIFDFLLDIGMKPFIELGFMPELLASGKKTCFHYNGNVTMPADDEKWKELIRLFAQHLLERYGKEEVSQWFFEVWNEPNLNFFFDGTQEDYFHLYEITARELKAADACFHVGGPATSVNAWIPEFRTFCEENQVPLDFITTHHYPSDDPLSTMGMNGPGVKGSGGYEDIAEQIQKLPPEEMQKIFEQYFSGQTQNPRDIMYKMTAKAREEAGPYPLYYTEWNGAVEFDTSYQAAFVLHTLAHNENLVEGYSYWTVSDIFEEQGMKPEPFKNEFGIQTNHGVRKPVYQAFKELHSAGTKRLEATGEHRTVDVLALTDGEITTVFVYNHDIVRRDIKEEEVRLTLKGNVTSICKAVIDDDNCNPRKAWEELGSPLYLSKAQLAKIEDASHLKYTELTVNQGSEEHTIDLLLQPEAVVVLKIK